MDLRFKHPFTGVIAGPTSCGKTVFMKKFIEKLDVLVDKKIDDVIWYYDQYQPIYNSVKAKFVHGLPDLKDFDGRRSSLLILDDLMSEVDNRTVDIFSKGSHHKNLSVFFITQNLFHQGRGHREITLNSHYIIYFKNPRDRAQIKYFARQLYPENSKFVIEAYIDSTQKPHGYLLFDFKQNTPEVLRLRTNILEDEGQQIVYIPKKGYKYDTYSEFIANY